MHNIFFIMSAPPAPSTPSLLDNVVPLLIYSLKHNLPYSQVIKLKGLPDRPSFFKICLSIEKEESCLDDAYLTSLSLIVQSDLQAIVLGTPSFSFEHTISLGPISISIQASDEPISSSLNL